MEMALPWNAARRLLGGLASSPDPFFNHGRAESLSETTPRELTTEDTESTEDEVL